MPRYAMSANQVVHAENAGPKSPLGKTSRSVGGRNFTGTSRNESEPVSNFDSPSCSTHRRGKRMCPPLARLVNWASSRPSAWRPEPKQIPFVSIASICACRSPWAKRSAMTAYNSESNGKLRLFATVMLHFVDCF